jgi:hypothetical protein
VYSPKLLPALPDRTSIRPCHPSIRSSFSPTGPQKQALQLRNNAPGQDLVVTPALRLADGAETALDPVTIKSQEVKSIDLDTAIAAAAAPQLIGTYGSVVLRYRSPYAATLYAAMMVRRMGHAIAFHIDAIGESQDLQVGSREGIWWLPKDTTSDYLILTNQGKNILPLDLSLYDASGKQASQKVLLAPAKTTRYSIRKLILASGLTGSYGGIKISTSAHAGSLESLHFLFDETAGFSAILKMFDYNPNAKLEERDYARTAAWTLRAPMLALSNPDPALAFPRARGFSRSSSFATPPPSPSTPPFASTGAPPAPPAKRRDPLYALLLTRLAALTSPPCKTQQSSRKRPTGPRS